MKKIVDRKLKNELNDLYEKATKSDTLNLYATLKKELENSLKDDKDNSKLESFRMICENNLFLDFNVNVTAIIISIGGLVIDFNTSFPLSYCVATLTICSIAAVALVAFFVHQNDQNYKYLLYVLKSITPKKPSANYLVP